MYHACTARISYSTFDFVGKSKCGDQREEARPPRWKGAKKERPRLCETCPKRADAAVLRVHESCVHTCCHLHRPRCALQLRGSDIVTKATLFPPRPIRRQLHRTTLRRRCPERYETPER